MQADANAATLHRLLAPPPQGVGACLRACHGAGMNAEPESSAGLDDFDPMAAAAADAAAEFAADWADSDAAGPA